MVHRERLLIGLIFLGVACSQSSDNGPSTGASGSAGSTTSGGNAGAGGPSGSGAGGSGGTSVTVGSTGTGGSGQGGAGTAGAGTAGAGTAGASGTAGAGGRGGAGGAAGAGGRAGAGGSAGGATDAGVAGLFGFFVTSTGSGALGGNFGGLAGADAKCQMLAAAVGAGARTWHAYLSLSGPTPVNARDRIGTGPWYNVRGVKIADDLAHLHEEGDAGMNGINGTTALDENGGTVPIANPNEHDIVTGSGLDGRALPATPDVTCAGWTSNSAGTAEVGHENRNGTNPLPNRTYWNASHTTPNCTQAGFQMVGGAARLYCFAIN
jgi:hypothetical protein